MSRATLSVIAVLAAVGPVPAAPVTSISGTSSFYTLSVAAFSPIGPVGNIVGVAFVGFDSLVFNGTAVATPNAAILGPFGTITSVTTDGIDTTYTISPIMGLESVAAPAGDVALFNLFLDKAVVNNADPDTVVLTGTKVLQTDFMGGSDFSPFAAPNGGTFVITLTKPMTDFNSVLAVTSVVTDNDFTPGSGTFSQAANDDGDGGGGGDDDVIPEPATLVVFAGLAGLGGVLARRRART
jgi:hypothetical protein